MNSHWLFVLSRWIVLFLLRVYFRIEYRGVEHVPLQGAMILAPNHASYGDPLWISAAIRRPLRYMTWYKLFQVPLLSPLIRAYGAFPVNIDKPGDRSAIRASLEQLEAGGGLVVFPEGGRTFTGNLQPFKLGVIRLAQDAQAPIVPVTIIGGYRAYSPHHWLPRPFKIRVVYHEPIRVTDGETKEELQHEAARLQAIVQSALPA